MDEDSAIRVLHYHNPHLMWVEVKNHDTYTFRQVGIFGIVPRHASLVDGERVCTKSDRWNPRANEIVEEFLESKHQLYFKSTYRLDDDTNQTSIFRKHPHIFGEIYSIKKQDGAKKQLVNCLDNSVYAFKSKNEFWDMLTDGKVCTKLDEAEELDVIQKIVELLQAKGTWNKKKDMFFKCLSPTHVAKLQESIPKKLTIENLEKHKILTSRDKAGTTKPNNLPSKNKNYQDFNINSKKLDPVDFVENVIKKFTIVENTSDKVNHVKEPKKVKTLSMTESVMSRITVYDEEINPQDFVDEEIDESPNHSRSHRAIGRAYNGRTHKPALPEQEESKFAKLLKLKDKRKQNKTQNVHKEPMDSKCTQDEMKESEKDERSEYFNELEEYVKARCSDFKNPCIAKTEERYVVYGPPTRNPQNLVQKRVKKEIDYTTTEEVKDDEPTWKGNIDWDDDGDSAVNFDKSKDSLENVTEKTHALYKNSPQNSNVPEKDVNKTDLNHSERENNDQVQNGLNELKNEFSIQNNNCRDFKLQDESAKEKENNSGIINQSLSNNTGDIKDDEPSQKQSKSKLLELMRRRKASNFNDSISSDDSSVKKDTNIYDTLSSHDASTEKLNLTNVISKTRNSKSSSHDSDDESEEIHAKLNYNNKPLTIETKPKIDTVKAKVNVNPYKNLDGSKSVFVENLITPLLLAHTKHNNTILPQCNLRDIPFKVEIHNTLRNMQVKSPSRLQSITWPNILRGHSVIMISAAESGKTLGYLPAVCSLVLDYNFDFAGLGPICIIVCATALSVSDVARACRMFVNHQKVVACFPGIDNTKLITDLRNGCDILVSTPTILYKLMGLEIGVDLRRLTTVVFEDCERLDKVYGLEVGAIQVYVRQMIKSRTDKQVQVQYVLASRVWCSFMFRLARKAPNTVIAFAAFHECVIYSKARIMVSFVQKSKKIAEVVEFLKETDDSKLTVIVCRSDDEVDLLESTLTRLNIAVVACNNQMTIHDLYKIRTEEHSSVLICCDGNLKHLNVTYAHYLVHFSMPALYTQFCARFAVLNDNYSSMFDPVKQNTKIKILLEETNAEQLPKILSFVKRFSYKVPEVLDKVAREVLEQKEISKAEKLVPVCDSLLSLVECANDTCQERHAVLKGYDDPKPWMPCNGVITFKIIRYNSAICYSARLLTHLAGGDRTKYPESYGTLCMKLGMFFSKEDNKRLHGEPKVGDVCAVSIRKNFIARCKVLKINNYEKGRAKFVAVNLIDEEQITVVRAVELYFLPEKFKTVETYVVKVRLASVRPQDRDVTFSELAMNNLKKITDDDEQLYLKGRVVMTMGNTIFVETLEACTELSALGETVVKFDFKTMLLDTHAIPDPDHLTKLQNLFDIGGLKIQLVPEVIKTKPRIVNKDTEYRWAHLDKKDWSDVLFSNTISAGKFFVRLQKFSKCINSLISDIKKHVTENPKPIEGVCVKDFVLAEFPDDSVYERAVVEEIIDETKVLCFFVDNADWREVAVSKLKPAPPKLFKRIPFQSIECRLVGVKPPGDDWTDFSTNWLHDNCLEDDKGNSKRIYAKYFTKEKAEVTGGHKYGVILVDTTTEEDVVVNKRMIELNLAAVKRDELDFLEKPLDFVREKTDTSSLEDDLDELDLNQNEQNLDTRDDKDLIPIPIKLVPNEDWDNDEPAEITDGKIMPYISTNRNVDDNEAPKTSLKNIFAEKPIKSFPLVNESDEDSDKWDICIDEDLGKCFGLPKLSQSYSDYNKKNNIKQYSHEVVTVKREKTEETGTKFPAITDVKNVNNSKTSLELSDKMEIFDTQFEPIEKHGSDDDNGYLNEKTTREPKYTNNTGKNTVKEPMSVDTSAKKNKVLTEALDTNGIELNNNIDILKGEIKDVSLYASDDTISITTTDNNFEISFEEPTKKMYRKELSDLDSDDTRSVLTGIDKELNFDNIKKGLDTSILDSDDSETKNEQNENTTNKLKNVKVKGECELNIQLAKTTIGLKGKVIPITEIAKAEIATNVKTDLPMKIVEINNDASVNKTKDKQSKIIKNVEKKVNEMGEKDVPVLKGKTITVTQTVEPIRTPPIVWKQDKNTITVKIKVMVDEYTLETGNRSLKFSAYQNEVKYSFDIELYGVIDSEKTTHCNKGQYILVNLTTMLKKRTKWLKLTKDFKNWIVYDVDSIDTSSDEEVPVNKDALKIIMDNHEKAMEFESDNDGVDDTSGYRFRED